MDTLERAALHLRHEHVTRLLESGEMECGPLALLAVVAPPPAVLAASLEAAEQKLDERQQLILEFAAA